MSNEKQDPVVYFELNNWGIYDYYPDKEPFISWMRGLHLSPIVDNEWVKNNKLVVVYGIIDMSWNFCITAKKSWVEENCSSLLTEDNRFLRYPEDPDDEYDLPEGRWNMPFKEYTENNFGVHFVELQDDAEYDYWKEI